MTELWSLLKFILPTIFDSEKVREMFQESFNRKDYTRDTKFISQSSKALQFLMIRRLKNQLADLQIPNLTQIDVFLPISPAQRAVYKALLMKLDEDTLAELVLGDENATDRDRNAITRLTGGKSELLSGEVLRSLLAQLRKVCNHPYILNPELMKGNLRNDDFINSSSKLLALDKLLPFLKAKGSRPLLFSQSTRMLNLLEQYCQWRGYLYCRLDGTTPQVLREYSMARFNHPTSKVFMFLISTRAGGLGLNLQTSDTVIFHESDWNPQADIQGN